MATLAPARPKVSFQRPGRGKLLLGLLVVVWLVLAALFRGKWTLAQPRTFLHPGFGT